MFAGVVFAQPAPALAFDDAKIDALIHKWNVPGASVAVVRDGKVVYEHGFGFVDASHSGTVDVEHSIFRIASLSKPITAAAVLQLVHAGKLSLDDKVFSLLTDYTPADPRAKNITIRQLLDMTAGWDKNKSGDPILQPYIHRAARKMHVESPPDFDVIARYWLRRKLDFNPGERFAYSNFEYGLLGKLIEQVSGKPYANYVRDTLFAPAHVDLKEAHTRQTDRLPDEVAYSAPKEGKHRSFFAGDPRKVLAPYARAYLETDLPMLGWASTAPQLALLFDYLLRDPQTRETICTGNKHFSMGWDTKRIPNGECTFFRDGTLPGTRAFASRTADGTTWVTLFNGRPTRRVPDPFLRELRQIMATVSSSPAKTKPASEDQTRT